LNPVEGHIFEAVLGGGAFHTLHGLRRRVHVSARKDLSIMPVITSTDFPEALNENLRRSLCGPWLGAISSVGIKVGYMVRKLADIYINHRGVHYWDTCAPQIIWKRPADHDVLGWESARLFVREGNLSACEPDIGDPWLAARGNPCPS